jgi:hypothetical protein
MAMSPKQKRVAVSAVLLAVGAVGCPLIRLLRSDPPDFRDSRSLYQWRGGKWTAAPHLLGGTDELEISSSGLLWATTPARNGIARWDGKRWVQYKGPDFGTLRDRLPGGFALQGDDVWVAAREGVARFDGQRWRLYPEALKTRRAAATAAGSSGVWVIDENANLSHFDGAAWSIEDLKNTPAGAQWKNRAAEDLPQMRVTADGAVWLLLYGLWRKDQAGWHEIRRNDIDWYRARMIGQDGDRVWLHGRSSIFELKADGGIGRSFDRRDLPVAKGAWVYRLAVGGGKIWLAAEKDLLAFDGNQWQHCGVPLGTTWVEEVAISADGSPWVVAETRSLRRLAIWLAPPLGAAALALLALGGLLVLWAKWLMEDRLTADRMVAQAAGAMPGLDMAAKHAAVKKQIRVMWWAVPLFLIGFPYMAFTLKGSGVLVLAPMGLAGAFLVWRWWRRRSKPGRLFGIELPLALFIAFTLILTCLPGQWLPMPHSRLATRVLVYGSVLLFVVLLQSRNLPAVFFTKKLCLAGEYDRALRRLRWLSFRSPTAQMLQAEGVIHAMAGRGAEAEQCFRRALAEAGGESPRFRSHVLGCLGFALRDLGRYEESQRCLESAIAMGDQTGNGQTGIADVLLQQGKEPERALALVEEAMRINQDRLDLPERLGDKAWALALMGRQVEMDQAMAAALRETNSSLKPLAAGAHWRIGMALLTAGRVAEAIEHFRTASETDPHGQNGMLSRLALERHQAPGG